jgi:hypothetical protein
MPRQIRIILVITQPKKINAVHDHPKKTNAYLLTTTPYLAYTPFQPTAISLNDDQFSGIVPIGFNFCFFGNSYSQCVIGSNGLLAFNTNYANTTCYANTGITFPINTNGALPNECIAFPFIDVDPSQGGSITYETMGNAPFRKFYVKFTNVPFFGGLTTATNTFYVCLNETSNTAEIHIQNKAITNSNPPISLDSAILGAQYSSTYNYVCAPNKNGGIWTSINEAWLITPNGQPDYKVDWYINGIIVATSADSATINFANQTSNVIKVKAVMTTTCPPLLFIEV